MKFYYDSRYDGHFKFGNRGLPVYQMTWRWQRSWWNGQVVVISGL